MSRLLLSLWLLGAALIVGSTLVAMNAIFGWASGPTKVERSLIAERMGRVEGRARSTVPPSQIASEHSPEDSASASSPQVAQPEVSVQHDPQASESEAALTAMEPLEEDDQVVRVRVARAANLRSGPSSSAARLASLPSGTELRAVAREKGWIQVADASGSQTGWIYEKLLEPMDSDTSLQAADSVDRQGEVVRVADSAAEVRAGPSAEAAMLFGFPYGRQLRVLSREAGFAEVVDLGSKQTGWIAESALSEDGELIASPQRGRRDAPYAATASSGEAALPWDENMRAEKPRKKARQARRSGFFGRAIRRGLGSY